MADVQPTTPQESLLDGSLLEEADPHGHRLITQSTSGATRVST